MSRPVPGPWLPPPIGPRYVVESGPDEIEWRAQCDRCGTDAAWRKGRDATRPTCMCTYEPEESVA